MIRRSLLLLVFSTAVGIPTLARAQSSPFGSCTGANDGVRQSGLDTVPIVGRPDATTTILTGSPGDPVSITCNTTRFWADRIEWDSDTGDIRATGVVTFRQDDVQITAERAELNGKTKFGTFYNASGSANLGSAPKEKSLFGTIEADIMFYGERIERVGPKKYRLSHGGFSSCLQPTPRWVLTGSDASIVLDKHVLLLNAVLRVKDVPLFYLPAIYYPINKEGRSTGFLIPSYGSSTYQGQIFSNAFFWVLGRSSDATFYHDWYSKTGQQFKADYRFMSAPGTEQQASFSVLNQHTPTSDTSTAPVVGNRSYHLIGRGNQTLPHGLRVIGNVDYFTDATTQQQYENIEESSRRARTVQGELSGGFGRYRFSARMDQSDTFFGATEASRRGRLPSASLSIGDKPIGRSRIYVGGSAEGAYILHQDDIADPTTNRSLWRLDGGPSLRATLSSLPYLTGTASASLKFTHWSESLDPLAEDTPQVPIGLNRTLLSTSVNMTGPSFSRVFQSPRNGYADRFKHVIEPNFSLGRTTPFKDFDRVVVNDSTDYAQGGDTTIRYGLTNRLLAHRISGSVPVGPGGARPGVVREILSVEISQSYHTNYVAANYDQNYESSSFSNAKPETPFSPLFIRVTGNPAEASSASFQLEIDPTHRAVRQLSGFGSFRTPQVDVSATWTKRQFIPGLVGFDSPANASQTVTGSTTIRNPGNHLGGSYRFTFDVRNRGWISQNIVGYYNSQCCGLALAWSSWGVPLLGQAVGQPANRTFTVTFTLAGIGSFSPPLGAFGGR